MELYSKPIEMSDMQWSEVVVESIVQQAVVHAEVVRLDAVLVQDDGRTVASPGRALAGRPSNWLLLGVGEDSIFCRGSGVGS